MKNKYSYLDDYLKEGRVEESLAILKNPMQKGSPYACLYGLAIFSGAINSDYRNINQFKRCFKLLYRNNKFRNFGILTHCVTVLAKISLNNPDDELLTYCFDSDDIQIANLKLCVENKIKHQAKVNKERNRECNLEIRTSVNEYISKAKEIISNHKREEALNILKESLLVLKQDDNGVIRKEWTALCLKAYELDKSQEEMKELKDFYKVLSEEARTMLSSFISLKPAKESIELSLGIDEGWEQYLKEQNNSVKAITTYYRFYGIMKMGSQKEEQKGFEVLSDIFFNEHSEYAYCCMLNLNCYYSSKF